MSNVAPISFPLLRDGERLTRAEFLRRWDAMPALKNAELIDGVVYLSSPVSLSHGVYDVPLATWLGIYAINTPGCSALAEATWLMQQDAPQPDLCMRILPEYGGQSGVEGIYAAGAPELVVEVSNSSASYDSGPKLRLYQRAGVREYVVALIKEQEIAWRELMAGGYRGKSPDAHGIFRSRQFPGLWLNEPALWAQDFAAVLKTLQQGMSSPEYSEFVQQLAAQRRK